VNPSLPIELAERLKQPLPGWEAQNRFQPELSYGRHRGPAPSHSRPAAVLAMLYPRHGQWHVPLILRPAHMLDHASQVSLPGGVIEPGETSYDAALREYAEELGAPADHVELLGGLSELYLFASDFRVIPWIGFVEEPPTWNPSPGEVDRVLEVPLAHLLNPASIDSMERRLRGISFRAPCFRWESERIWGATSMILAELVDVLGSIEP
jgi:8-oxo-dGTP pyrophosphatase MutT (NUDIX family)